MKLRFIRGLNAVAVDFATRLFLPDDDIPTPDFASFLKEAIKAAPGATLFLMAFDEEEPEDEKSLKGILVAFAEAHTKYVYISQLHIEENIPGVADNFYIVLTSWAESLRRSQLRMKTTRDPGAWTRKYGFEALYTCMTKEINEEFDVLVAKRIKRLQETEAQDVQGRPENDEFVDRKSAEYLKSGGGIPGSRIVGEEQRSEPADAAGVEAPTGSDSVHVPFGGPPAPAVQPGQEPNPEQLAEQIRQRNESGSELPS